MCVCVCVCVCAILTSRRGRRCAESMVYPRAPVLRTIVSRSLSVGQNGQSKLFTSLPLSFLPPLSLSLFVSLRLACVCVSSVSGLWMRMLYSPWFSPCTAGLSPLTHPLILLSVSDKRPLKTYPPAFPCLPDLFKQATPSLCRRHFHLCSDTERQIYTQFIYCMDLHKTN